jgi:hypothetical protein
VIARDNPAIENGSIRNMNAERPRFREASPNRLRGYRTMTYNQVGLRGVEPLTSRLSGRPYTERTSQRRERLNRCVGARVGATARRRGGVLALWVDQNGAYADEKGES